MSIHTDNFMNYEEAIIEDSYPVPYYRGFKNTTRKVVHVWQPLGQFKQEKAPAQGNSPLQAIVPKLVKRQGLSVTLKTVTGSYQEVRIPCTDELWDAINKNQIYKFKEDDIYLRFNENGEAYEYIIDGKTDSSKNVIYTEDYIKNSRIHHVRDVLNAQKKQESSNDTSWMGNSMVFNIKDPSNISLKLKSGSIGDVDVNLAQTSLAEILSSGNSNIEPMQMIAEDLLVKSVANGFITIVKTK